MILPFSQHLNGKPTHFVEKILVSPARQLTEEEYVKYMKAAEVCFGGKYDFNWIMYATAKPKLHTLREDKKNRWRAGMKIHPVINNRSKNQLQFSPTMLCKRKQKVLIEWRGTSIIIRFSTRTYIEFNTAAAWDKSNVNFARLKQFSENDGFDTLEDFLQYFSAGLDGKIIHWTDLKY